MPNNLNTNKIRWYITISLTVVASIVGVVLPNI